MTKNKEERDTTHDFTRKQYVAKRKKGKKNMRRNSKRFKGLKGSINRQMGGSY